MALLLGWLEMKGKAMFVFNVKLIFVALFWHPIVCILLFASGACSVSQPLASPSSVEDNSVTSIESGAALAEIVIIGTTRMSGLKVAFDNEQVARELADQLATQHAMLSALPTVTRHRVGARAHDEMMAFYARHGRLAPHHIQRLMDTELPAPIALLMRLESDNVERLPVVVTDALPPLHNHKRSHQNSRFTFTTRRITSLSVRMVNLRNGREVQARLYTYKKDMKSTNDYGVGNTFIQHDVSRNDDDLLDIISGTFYPLPSLFSHSMSQLIRRAVSDFQFPLDL